MKKLLLFFILFISAVPALVSAEGNTPGVKSEPEALLSDSAKGDTPQEVAPKEKKKKKKHVRKVSYEESAKNQISMTEEEQHIMQTRNKSDRYRTTKQKPDNKQK